MAVLVFAADSHLNKHYARMTADQLAERRARLRSAWEQSVAWALAERADLYVHGGDLFDTPSPRAADLIHVSRQLRRLADAGVRTLLVGGNHDVPKARPDATAPHELFDAVGLARHFRRHDGVEWWSGDVGGTRLAVGGLAPNPRLGGGTDPLVALAEPIEPPQADTVLLVAHCAVEGALHPMADEPVIGRASLAALAGKVHCLLVGHVHAAGISDVEGVTVVCPGPTERMTFGEIDARCGFAVIEATGTGLSTRRRARLVDVEPQPMRRETVHAPGIPFAGPTEWLMAVVRRLSAPDQVLQLRLAGPIARDTYHAIRFLDLWQLGNELNFYFDLDRRSLSVTDARGAPGSPAQATGASEAQRQGSEPADAAAIGARAEIARIAAELLAEASDRDEAALVSAARDLALERYRDEDGAA